MEQERNWKSINEKISKKKKDLLSVLMELIYGGIKAIGKLDIGVLDVRGHSRQHVGVLKWKKLSNNNCSL